MVRGEGLVRSETLGSREELIASHLRFMATGRFVSALPQPTDIPFDIERLRSLVDGTSRFENQVLVTYMQFEDGRPYVTHQPEATSKQRELGEAVAELLQPIDKHFRRWCGISDDPPTTIKPVELLAGIYELNEINTAPHLDVRGGEPRLNYKLHFMGDPQHSSVYYPGVYEQEGRLLLQYGRELSRHVPSPQRIEGTTKVVMPSGVVCVEPWNAVHGGACDVDTAGLPRGVLAVSYPLRHNPAPNLNTL